MVLVHGGGGTAFADWVKLWTARGYAAISMSYDGMMPTETTLLSNSLTQQSPKPSGPAFVTFTISINRSKSSGRITRSPPSFRLTPF